MTDRITPVILCGGGGVRLWPLSRRDRPKQLLALAGTATMLQQTALRTAGSDMFDAPVVISGIEQADEIERQLGAAGTGAGKLILEPCPRNTAAAILLAALDTDPEARLLVMPSDHAIEDSEAFRAAVAGGMEAAGAGWLVTFGIAPTRPETGYGYIRLGEALTAEARKAEAFVEKPDRARAQAFLSGGDYVWNAGIFLFRAGALVEAARDAAPDIVEAASAALERRRVEGRRIYPDGGAFAAAPSLSIDHAVMEKAKRVAVVPFAGGWSDVGSWDALHEISPRDSEGNALSGEVIALDSSGCLIRSDEGPPVVAIGLRDLVVVSTRHGILVMPRAESQRVREGLALLEQRRPDGGDTPRNG